MHEGPAHKRATQDREREATKQAAAAAVGKLSDRELFLAGVVLFRVSIRESANVKEAEDFWAGLVGVEPSAFQKVTLKKHNPKTSRKNTEDAYRGCLVIYVLKSADLYRRMEGAWYGIVGGAARQRD